MTIYKCMHCGNMVMSVKSSGVPMVCCGDQMTELIPGTSDGAVEKHVPVYEVKDGKVTVNVGSVDHPMIAEHYIEWVAIETNLGCRLTKLKPETAPKCVFTLEEGETVKEVLAYCNLHGLWKA